GVQSTHADTLANVGRKSDLEKLFANIRRLKEETGVVLHLDLVAGLPGEDFAGFTASLDRLLTAAPHHIQVEPLKVLKGTQMNRIARDNKYAWSPAPPYRILGTPWLTYGEICRIETASQAIELLHNSGRFSATMETIARTTPLAALFTDRAMASVITGSGRNGVHSVCPSLLKFLAMKLPSEAIPQVVDAVRFDYCMAGYPGQTLPGFLAVAGRDNGSSEPPIPYPELARRLSLPQGSRFKTFTASFTCNYTTHSRESAETRITFIYAGNGTGGAIHRMAEPFCT
ncbi:MAG TPA: DUF4080 domain-containing protein, partial [Geobacteraceae bacterium]|nr:DUF4080 domain-containing protein [Geobacteraceae bacterium]